MGAGERAVGVPALSSNEPFLNVTQSSEPLPGLVNIGLQYFPVRTMLRVGCPGQTGNVKSPDLEFCNHPECPGTL